MFPAREKIRPFLERQRHEKERAHRRVMNELLTWGIFGDLATGCHAMGERNPALIGVPERRRARTMPLSLTEGGARVP